MERKVLSGELSTTLLCTGKGSISGITLVSAIFLLASFEVVAANVDGEHGLLHVYGQLVDSPCRLSMDSRDQTVDLGTLASGDMDHLRRRSQPEYFSVRLQGCLLASGHLKDERSDSSFFGTNQPVVNVGFSALADLSDPSLIKLKGVGGIALRLTDSRGGDIRLGSRGMPLLLTPGNNTLTWAVQVERVPGQFVPGNFQAITDFRISYD